MFRMIFVLLPEALLFLLLFFFSFFSTFEIVKS